MKRTIVSLYLVVVLSVPSILAQQQTYSVGTGPLGVAFDGSNIWVANSGDNSVTKLLASTGAVVGTFSVGSNPVGVVFDGTNIWVTNEGSNNVTKLLASNGAVLGTYSVGNSPVGVTFDGTDIWVANGNDATVTKLLARTGAVVGTFSAGGNPFGVAFDGTNIWVTNTGGTNTVTELLASTGAVVGTFSVGSNPANAAFDGTTIWVTNDNVTTVTQLLASTGALAGTYSVGSNPWGVTFDGSNIWVTNAGSNTVTKIPDRPPCNYNIVSTDNAGNFGFTAPVLNPGPNPALPNINSASVHQTIPLQVTATDCHGNPATNLTLAPSGTVVLTAANANVCTVDNPDNSISIDSAGNSGWQNLGGGIYQYNWKPLPPKGACLSFLLNLGDGIQHIAYFQFK